MTDAFCYVCLQLVMSFLSTMYITTNMQMTCNYNIYCWTQLIFAICQVWNVVPVMCHECSLRICCFWTLWRLKLWFLAQASGCPKSTAHKASTSQELVYSSLMPPTLDSTLSWPDPTLSWPDHPASQITFPHEPFLFQHLITDTLYHYTFAM